MSYDLTVYAVRELDEAAFLAVVGTMTDLDVEDDGDGEVKIVRGEERAYAFTVFGPDPVELDELPDEVLPLLSEPIAIWRVVVEGSDPDEFPAARRFAETLATASGGVAFDEQTGSVLDRDA